jgi:glutathione S-transferase
VARVALQLRIKGAAHEIASPEGGIKSAAYLAMNPIGKMPTLDDGGFFLPESAVIMEYIEDKIPTPSLRPKDAQGAARDRLLCRLVDLYLFPALFAPFGQMSKPPAERDQAFIDTKLAETAKALDYIEHYLGGGTHAVGNEWCMADCVLISASYFMGVIGGAFGKPDLVGDRPKLKAVMAHYQSKDIVKALLAEMGEGMKAMMANRR